MKSKITSLKRKVWIQIFTPLLIPVIGYIQYLLFPNFFPIQNYPIIYFVLLIFGMMVYLVNRKYMLKISIKDNSKILEIENFSILDNIHIEKIMIKNIRKIKIGGTNTFNQSYLKITEMDNKETKMILSDDEIKEVCNSTVQNLKQIV